MLAQHLITKPVFDALFNDYSFAKHNPMSLAMSGVLEVLQEHHLNKEADTLQRFYESVKLRAEGIDNATGKQKIVVELYDKFFRNAFPKMTERLGIVYTPVEVVDFIIQSVEIILQSEFGQSLGSDGVHIIDPFSGTGTFITRLFQSGLISEDQLGRKYKHEIHANELVLLAYYIAAINIEAVYHSIAGGEYIPFEGICLTDTFQMYEKDDLVDALLVDNSARRKRQKQLDIRVIIGNPPYSIGQEDEGDNTKRLAYPHLDERIRSTYAEHSRLTNKKSLYDSYIRAIRWASDRVGESGVIGFVTNAGYIDAATADGMRRCLADEFSCIYVFHLRGNQRTSGELSRREGGKIFGSGSRAPIAISLLVKNPSSAQHGQIYFHDIGDYLSREEKLEKIRTLVSVAGITEAGGWQTIVPNDHGDWLAQRDNSFNQFIVMGEKKGNGDKLFSIHSQGLATSRDAWCYNSSKEQIVKNMTSMIKFYNSESHRFHLEYAEIDKESRAKMVDGFINTDRTKISWSVNLKNELLKNRQFVFEPKSLIISTYRPFSKQWVYYNRRFNHSMYQMPRIFPDATADNRAIMVKGNWGADDGQIALIVDNVVCLLPDGGAQCFPLYLYDEPKVEEASESPGTADMFSDSIPAPEKRKRRDALTDEGLVYYQTAYPTEVISKEDVFYYVYGLLHSPDYRERYADNLSKELPRIPCVKSAAHFYAFSQAGRRLADLHLNYESVPCFPVEYEAGALLITGLEESDYRVTKMKFASKVDKSRVIYNNKITMTGIPLEAYEYVVNGKPALEWVMERQAVTTHKDTGIVNDANLWATETMGNARYPLELFQRLITVSLETMKIVRSLPKLEVIAN
jgi:predicted helicase